LCEKTWDSFSDIITKISMACAEDEVERGGDGLKRRWVRQIRAARGLNHPLPDERGTR
jgi:hypothetical protein